LKIVTKRCKGEGVFDGEKVNLSLKEGGIVDKNTV
jgi:hypothetical protein